MGVLRALESLKLIPHVDAISSVSGGTWASSIYMFAKDVSIKERSAGKQWAENKGMSTPKRLIVRVAGQIFRYLLT